MKIASEENFGWPIKTFGVFWSPHVLIYLKKMHWMQSTLEKRSWFGYKTRVQLSQSGLKRNHIKMDSPTLTNENIN